MKIVIIDDLNLEPEQLKTLQKRASLAVYQNKPTEKEAIKRAAKGEIIITNTTKITRKIIKASPKLKMIAAAATGAELIVDLKAAKKKKVVVTNVPGYATQSVAELTFALILNLARKINQAGQSVKNGSNLYQPFLGWELKGKTLGIIGLGKIGSRVAEIGLSLGMRVIANDIKTKKKKKVKMVALKPLLKLSDVLTIHCDNNPTSNKLLKAKELNLVKPTAILINTAREEIIDEKALVKNIKAKKIAGLGMEFNILKKNLNNHPLLKLENVILTPHIGFFTKQALKRRKEIVVDNVLSFLAGKGKNIFLE